jgi:predicted amidohydrolase
LKIAVAQISPVKGDVNANILKHKALIEIAATHEVDFVIFPELSLTGYEPTLARSLAVSAHDKVLDELHHLSMFHHIVVGAGIPTRHEQGICISLILFFPDGQRKVCSKKFLHADEMPFFVPGDNIPVVTVGGIRIALAICYEISVDEHLKAALREKPQLYVASVAKSEKGIGNALERLAVIASANHIPAMMANCTGQADGVFCPGRSAAWSDEGALLQQLGDEDEGLVIYDTATAATSTKRWSGILTDQ